MATAAPGSQLSSSSLFGALQLLSELRHGHCGARLPAQFQFCVWGTPTLQSQRTVLCVMWIAVEVDTAKDASLCSVVVEHLSRAFDPHKFSLPCGLHQADVASIVDENVRRPNVIGKPFL